MINTHSPDTARLRSVTGATMSAAPRTRAAACHVARLDRCTIHHDGRGRAHAHHRVGPVEREGAERGAGRGEAPGRFAAHGPGQGEERQAREERIQRRLQNQDLVEDEQSREGRRQPGEQARAASKPLARRQRDQTGRRRAQQNLDHASRDQRVSGQGEDQAQDVRVERSQVERVRAQQEVAAGDAMRQFHVDRIIQHAAGLQGRMSSQLDQDDEPDDGRDQEDGAEQADAGQPIR